MGHVEADGVCDPVAHVADAALVAAWAEVPGLAGEGQQFFVAAVGALQAGEPGGEVAAVVELIHHGHGVAAQWAVGLAVGGFVPSEKVVPGVVDDLPEGRGPRPPGAVDGGHVNCSLEQFML